MDRLSFFLHLASIAIIANCAPFTPIVIWHGMGDSCCYPWSMGSIETRLKEALPGVQVHSLQIGKNILDDVENGYFMHPDDQIRIACQFINQTADLKNGFNALGFSQGGQFLRGLVQKCPEAHVKNLVSIGGQHQGVYGLPNCGSLSNSMCDYIRELLNHAAYLGWVQKDLAQATYWHDPLNEEEYRNYSTFLADLNNERVINQTYITRLQSLDNFILIKFENDTVVDPVETEWFGFYKPGQSRIVQTLNQSDLYIQDRLGLQKLQAANKLHFLSTPGNHLKFEWSWFNNTVIAPYLRT